MVAGAPGARVFRLGGDEFCVVGDLDGEALDRIVLDLASAEKPAHDMAQVSASVGLAAMPDDTADPDTAMRLADERMYANKLARRLPSAHNAPRAHVVISDAGRATVRV